jgi:D-alanyl-D-alanine endopeptidase (penicillin-binding protein 7)
MEDVLGTAKRTGMMLAAVAGACLAAVPAAPVSGAAPARATGAAAHAGGPAVRSNVALVVDESRGETLFAKNVEEAVPIASITKLLTAMTVLDAGLPLDEPITIDRADVDHRKNSRSRLQVGWRVKRGDLLRVALMSSDNRAAAALARTYPGGLEACVAAMNRKAADLGMQRTRMQDPTGLSAGNVASAEDLVLLVRAASRYPEIRAATTSWSDTLRLSDGHVLEYHNSNGLVANKAWSIGLSKTGYINEAGRCLVMQAEIAARQVVIVLLDSWGKYTRLGDANRIRHWLESTASATGSTHGASAGHASAGHTSAGHTSAGRSTATRSGATASPPGSRAQKD